MTGAGFGVTATERVVVRLCADGRDDGRRAVRVRTDMLPSPAVQAGALGEALAGTLVDVLPGCPVVDGSRGAEVVRRLLDGGGRPGAFTPAALFGSGLATDAGGVWA